MNDIGSKIARWFHFGTATSVAYASGMMLLLTIVLIYCIASFELLIGLSVSVPIVPVAFVLATAVVTRYSAKRCFLLSALINVCAWAICIMAGKHIYDCSWDGIDYHQMTIYALADGWNPIWDASYKEWLSLWSKHYAYGIELISACIFRLTGDIESGKAVNFLFGIAAFLICYSEIRGLRPGMSKRFAILLALIAVCNPVWICQAPTFYIDYALYFFLLMTIAFTSAIVRQSNMSLSTLGLAGIIVLAIGTKFNHFFLEGVAVLAILAWLVIIGNKSAAIRILKISVFAGISGVVLFAIHPYLTNWVTQGNPFYPLMGDGAVDIMTCNTPGLYKGHGRFTNFLLSIYGSLSFPGFDSRSSGFGPLFKFLFTVCVVCIAISEIRNKRMSVIGYVAVCVLGSCFFFEQSWWARYNPQIWMIVPLALYAVFGWKKGSGRLLGLWGIGILAIINVALSLTSPIIEGLRLTAYRNAVFEVFSGRHVRAHVGVMWEERLFARGLVPEVVDENAIPEDGRITLLYIPEYGIKYNWLEADADDKAKIDSIYKNHPICVFRNNLVEHGKPAYRSIKSKLGWKSSD